eukprot:scaffold7537_cov179-Ochromonas_danica.AAC.14
MIQLLEECCDLAKEEEHVVKSLDTFLSFMQDMLPREVLGGLEEIYGGSDFLEDLWKERYEEKDTTAVVVVAEEEVEEEEEVDDGSCQICERHLRRSRHHVFPREVHNRLKKKGYPASSLNTTIAICRLCHSTIHRLFTNEELAESYYTIELLLEDSRFGRYAKWAAKLHDHRYIRY